MSEQTFSTRQTAADAGWHAASRWPFALPAGLEIRDVSSANSYGYQYAVCDVATGARLLLSTSVYLAEVEGRMGHTGVLSEMFNAEDVARLTSCLA